MLVFMLVAILYPLLPYTIPVSPKTFFITQQKTDSERESVSFSADFI